MADQYDSVVQIDVDNGKVTHTVLVDSRPTTQSFCQRSWKFLLIILAISVVCNIGLIIYVVKSSTDESEAMPFTKNPNNSRTWDHADEQYTGACIYNTSTAFLKKLEKDPFGDLCRRDSPTCQEGHSTHACKSCRDEKVKFPSFCFCDRKGHCNHMGGQMPFDSQQNSNCSDCLGNFHLSPFSARGTCTCPKGPRKRSTLQCDCHEGFTGIMCSSIGSRYCTSRDNKPQIPHCKDSNEESCHLNQDGKYYLCKAFIDSNTKRRRSASSCEIIVTP